jgi:hypothetical protein
LVGRARERALAGSAGTREQDGMIPREKARGVDRRPSVPREEVQDQRLEHLGAQGVG